MSVFLEEIQQPVRPVRADLNDARSVHLEAIQEAIRTGIPADELLADIDGFASAARNLVELAK